MFPINLFFSAYIKYINFFYVSANFPLNVVQSLPKDLEPGVYYGWAQIDNSPIYKMVVNIGWCPFYQNKEKSVETHVMHKFEKDFYGSNLRIAILGYLRGEMNFSSLDGLITQIKTDISNAEKLLEKDEYQTFKNESIFTQS